MLTQAFQIDPFPHVSILQPLKHAHVIYGRPLCFFSELEIRKTITYSRKGYFSRCLYTTTKNTFVTEVIL